MMSATKGGGGLAYFLFFLTIGRGGVRHILTCLNKNAELANFS